MTKLTHTNGVATTSNGIIPKLQEKERYNDDMIKILKMGCDMLKYKKNGKKYKRHFFLDPDELTLRYSGSKKFWRPQKIIEIPEIREIRTGPNTATFRELADRVKDSLAFSLVFGNKHDTLDLVAKSPEIKEQWITALKHVISLYKNMEQEKEHEKWAIDHFNKADVNKDGGLSFEETLQLLNHMNINMDKRYAKKLFDASDIDTKKTKGGEDVLDQKEFLNFYKLLIRRPEIVEIIRQYSKTGSSYLEPNELLEFMHKEQKQPDMTIDNCVHLIETYEKTTKEGTMGVEGMRCMLASRDQALFNKNHLEVYQDMSKPLSDYFINSSHNTYLCADQIIGPCSVENYIKVLREGCRCIEVDAWDGVDGDPVVYHGHTLTPKIKFSDVITAIASYAFETTPFPVIISLENHCSIDQQKLMAHYFKSILLDKLYIARLKAGDLLPSPNYLKEKIIIKGKKMEQPDQLVEIVSEEDEAADMDDQLVKNDLEKHPPTTALKLAKELSDLIYLRSTHFKGLNNPGKSNFICSFAEAKALTLINERRKEVSAYHKTHLSRIYPGGMRTDSSNYDPMSYWKAGCQIVAMNFQNDGKKMQIYQAKFRDNGGAGYVLKPDYLLSDYDENTAQPMELRPKLLKIKIISAQQLPKPSSNANDKDVVDPYVKIEIIGFEHTQNAKTRIIENNGFNPVWNESFDFVIDDPQSAILRFVVKDFNSSSKAEFIGQYTIPFNSLMEGYHHAHLKNKKSLGIPPATLFIYTQIEEYKDNFINNAISNPSGSLFPGKRNSFTLSEAHIPIKSSPRETGPRDHFDTHHITRANYLENPQIISYQSTRKSLSVQPTIPEEEGGNETTHKRASDSQLINKQSHGSHWHKNGLDRSLAEDKFNFSNILTTNNNIANRQRTTSLIATRYNPNNRAFLASLPWLTNPEGPLLNKNPGCHLHTTSLLALDDRNSLHTTSEYSGGNADLVYNPYKPLSPARLPNGVDMMTPFVNSALLQAPLSQYTRHSLTNLPQYSPSYISSIPSSKTKRCSCTCRHTRVEGPPVKTKIRTYPPHSIYLAPLIINSPGSAKSMLDSSKVGNFLRQPAQAGEIKRILSIPLPSFDSEHYAQATSPMAQSPKTTGTAYSFYQTFDQYSGLPSGQYAAYQPPFTSYNDVSANEYHQRWYNNLNTLKGSSVGDYTHFSYAYLAHNATTERLEAEREAYLKELARLGYHRYHPFRHCYLDQHATRQQSCMTGPYSPGMYRLPAHFSRYKQELCYDI